MARLTTNRVFSSFDVASSATQGEDTYDQLITEIAAYQSNGVTAWELYDDIAARDKVFRSVGDRTINGGAGDAVIYMRLVENLGIRFRVYQDWSTSSHTGSRGTSEHLTLITDNVAVKFFYALDEYEFVFGVFQSGVRFDWGGVGITIRDHVIARESGVAFNTSQVVGAGAATVIPVDRDLQNLLHVGQKIWFIPQTPTGSALASATIETTTVTALDAFSVTVALLNNTYEIGSIVGLDPCPSYAIHSANGIRMCHDGAGAAFVGTVAFGLGCVDFLPGNDHLDPSVFGFHQGASCRIAEGTLPDRGAFGLFLAFEENGTESAAEGEYYRVDGDNSQRYWPINNLPGRSQNLSMGPLPASFPAGTNFPSFALDLRYDDVKDASAAPSGDPEFIGFFLPEVTALENFIPPSEHPDAPITVDHCATTVDKLLQQFKKQVNWDKLICVFAAEADVLDQQMANVAAFRSLSTALGKQLDLIGEMLDLERGGFDDDNYRAQLKAVAYAKSSHSSINDIIKLAQLLDNGFDPGAISVDEEGIAAVRVSMSVPGDFDIGFRFSKIIKLGKAAGVRLVFLFVDLGETLFSWEESIPDGDPPPLENSGWAQNLTDGDTLPGGIWAEAL